MNHLLVYTPDKATGIALCNLLRRRSLKPIHYTDAEQILEKIRFGLEGVVVLDFSSLASMFAITKDIEDILEFADRIPMIVLSPYSHDDKEMKSFQERGYYILEKPVQLENLVKIISRLMKTV